MYRTVPKLATAAISAGAAVTANPPSTVSAEAFHAPEYQPSAQIFGRGSQSSSRTSSATSSSVFCADWDFLVKEDLQSSGVLGPVPTPEESEEATRYVLESLHSDPGFMYDAAAIFSDTSASLSWPEADASMAASEAAMAVARRALQVSESNALIVPAATHASAVRHLQSAFDLLQRCPEETKEVVESLTSDTNVWNAISQNPAFLNFMAKNSTVRIEDVTDANEPDPNTYGGAPERVEKSDESKKSSNGFQQFVHEMVVGLGSILNSISGFLARTFAEPKAPTEVGVGEGGKEPGIGGVGQVAGIFSLVIMVIAIIVMNRR